VILAMTEPSHAVFLSYASQDAEAAKKICEALRTAGIEVWFDQSELRGGDAWDQKIRRELQDCTLFMPVISAHTAARHEGYFRLEWDLADQRTHMIARNRAFILPVCVDATPETNADTPESFQRVQWTRLLGGATPPAFVQRVQRLLSGETLTPSRAHAASGVAPAPGSRRMWSVAAVLVVLLAPAGYLAFEKPRVAKGATFAPPPHSVAVLPFVNMSGDKEQEYFSDGLSEELIDLLARVPGLAVPARTSSFYFKNTSTRIPDIAKQLGVSHILEGSVRKSGNRLRVAVQLVRADNGYHLWSATYDRELRDVFKMQDDIAGAVVSALKVTLLADRAPRSIITANTEAYTLYLQARELFQRGTATDYQSAYEHLVQALRLDPRFAAAWSEIARVRVRQYYLGEMPMAQAAPEAHDAIQKALHLDPELAEAHLTNGRVLYFFDWDWQGADTEMKRALLLDPSIGESYRWAAMTARTLGRFDEAQSLLREALARDPLEAFSYGTISGYYMQSGQWTEALKAGARAHDLMPRVWGEKYIAEIALARGDPQAALTALSHVESPIEVSSLKARAFRALGRNADADIALAELEKLAANDAPAEIARIYALRGDRDLAFKWLDRSYELRDVAAADIKGDPDFNNLKTDPRYAAFLRKMKLPQ
jgi:TolB-like protein/Flp pilus assembly protein TadD